PAGGGRAGERAAGRGKAPEDQGRRPADWERNPVAWYRPAAPAGDPAARRQPAPGDGGQPPRCYPSRGEYPRRGPGQPGRGGRGPDGPSLPGQRGQQAGVGDHPSPGSRRPPASVSRFPAERRRSVPPSDPAAQFRPEYRRSPTQPARRDVALRERGPAPGRPPPPRPPSASPPRKRRHPWATIVLLSVGLIVATYGLVKFGYGPERHQANVHPKTSETTARKKPATIPSFPLPTHAVGMALNPPYSKSLPPVVQVLGKDPGIVESYLSFPGTFPLDQIQYLDQRKILPLIQM